MYVIVTLNGVGLIGPFSSEEIAIDVAKRIFHSRTRWIVRPMTNPTDLRLGEIQNVS